MIFLQDMIRNKARNGQNCCLLEQAYAMVSSLSQRSDNTHHVSLIENYPANLEALGEPIRQVKYTHYTDKTILQQVLFIIFLYSYAES